MNYFLYRFSPSGIGILAHHHLTVICPSRQVANYLERGFDEHHILACDDFSLANLLDLLEAQETIDTIFTLDEGLMHLTGLLTSILTSDKQAWKVAYAYKDKKIMRQRLEGQIPQPTLIHPDEKLPKQFMVKPRCEASGNGVFKVSQLPDNYSNEDYLLETVEEFDTMFTCDGIALDGKITYFFSHEYIGNILDIKTDFVNIVRTNSHYPDKEFIKRLQVSTQKVLDGLGTEPVHPFHAEFFYNSQTDTLSFCEIGKRFGGANIPLLIKNAFQIDILELYWQAINGNPIPKQEQDFPTKIACTLAIFQNGRHQAPPTLPVPLDAYRSYPEKTSASAQSLDDLRFLINFSLEDETAWEKLAPILKEYSDEQRN